MRYLMLFALGFGAACFTGCYLAGGIWVFLAVAGVVAMALAWGVKRYRKQAAIVLAGTIVGVLWFTAFSAFVLSAPKEMDGSTRHVVMTAVDYSYETDYGSAVDGQIQYNGRSYRVKIYLNTRKQVLPGDQIAGMFRLRYTGGGAQSATYHIGKGTFLLAYPAGETVITPGDSMAVRYFPVRLRNATLQMIDRVFPQDTAAFAKSLLLGDDSQMAYETLSAFSLTGVRHIIAVSGLHVSIFLSMVCILTKKRPVLTAIIGMPILFLFSAVVGFTPSIIRACMMQVLLWLALCIDKEYDAPTAMSLAALVVLLQNPWAASSVSFQLSFGSVAGILLFAGPIQGCLQKLLGNKRKWKVSRFLCASVSVSLSANVLIIPIMAYYFGAVSLIGMLANLLILWVVPVVFGGILLACCMGTVWLGGAGIIAELVSVPIRYVVGVTEFLSKIPLAAVYTQSKAVGIWILLSYLMGVILMLRKGKNLKWLITGCGLVLCVALMVSFLLPLGDNYRMTVLDVGQGQCILLQSDGKTFMVDCGGDSNESVADLAVQTLFSQGITRLDGLVLTHYDKDHAGGAEYLLKRLKVETLFLPEGSEDTELETAITAAASGNVITVDKDILLSFGQTQLSIFSSQDLQSSNESSLCVLFQRENCDILITGDRSTTGELLLLQTGRIPDLDILVAGHHGSESSTGEFLLKSTTPETVIISVGADNSYGHPSDAVLDRLETYGCVVRRTDLEGTIIIRG